MKKLLFLLSMLVLKASAQVNIDVDLQQPGHPAGGKLGQQIGRASCRERV